MVSATAQRKQTEGKAAVEVANRRLKTENRKQDSGDRIITASAPGIAAEEPPDCQTQTFNGTVPAQGFQRILGTSGGKPAGGRGKGRYAQLVAFNQQDQGKGQNLFQTV